MKIARLLFSSALLSCLAGCLVGVRVGPIGVGGGVRAGAVGNPAEDQRGRIRQGQLEGSNVDPTRELVELIRTQRAFEMNSQSIRAADEALQTVAQLRR